VLAGGQSGHVASPHYADQLDTWLAGKTRPMPFSDEAVDACASHRQTLLPAPTHATRARART
jgi:penicillin amidase